jgi:two-component system, NarL family, response regulator
LSAEINSTIKVLVADDHPLFRQGIVATLSFQPDMFVVGEAANGREAVEMFRRHQPDVGLLDLQMPRMNGLEAIIRIRAENPVARIIVLTTFDSDKDIQNALQAGAYGYLLKETGGNELVAAIRAVYRGQKRISAEVGARIAETAGNPDSFTERELEVLQLMTEGQNNKEIAELLSIGESTVKFHIKHIYAKLQVADRTQAVITALKRGITRV